MMVWYGLKPKEIFFSLMQSCKQISFKDEDEEDILLDDESLPKLLDVKVEKSDTDTSLINDLDNDYMENNCTFSFWIVLYISEMLYFYHENVIFMLWKQRHFAFN